MSFAITPILKLCETCNFGCDFCRYAGNTVSNMMSLDTCIEIIEKVLAWNRTKGINSIELNFHGGEPMLWGKECFRNLLAFEAELCDKDKTLQIVNSIQTNGSLIDMEWLEIFRKGRFRIGLSIDGPESLNYHLDQNGKGIVENGIIELLNKERVPFGVLSVITPQHFGNAQNLYDFYCKSGIHNVGLCYCFDSRIQMDDDKLSQFLIDFYRLVFEGEYTLNVRELDAYTRKILKKHAPYCMFCERKSCGRYLTFTGDKNVFFCDPENKKDSYVGDLNQSSLQDIICGEHYVEHLKRIQDMFESTCCKCEYLRICGGGCSRTDINGKNAFCEMYKRLLPQVKRMVYPYIERYPKTFQRLEYSSSIEGRKHDLSCNQLYL